MRDGDNPSDSQLAYLTGDMKNNPKFITSTGSTLYFYIHTNLGESRRGFRLRYYSGCSITVESLEGKITSPAFGVANYPNNQECTYLIKRPGGGRLSLKVRLILF